MKDEPDESDNLAALADFKEEDLKEFENVNDFPNGEYIQYLKLLNTFFREMIIDSTGALQSSKGLF